MQTQDDSIQQKTIQAFVSSLKNRIMSIKSKQSTAAILSKQIMEGGMYKSIEFAKGCPVDETGCCTLLFALRHIYNVLIF